MDEINEYRYNEHINQKNTSRHIMNKQIAYCRVSTKEQSLESQTTTIKAQFPDAVILSEHGVSGLVAANERKEFSKLLDTNMGLRKGDTLIIWWFDRIGRDYQDAKAVTQELLKRGVTIKTINQSLELKYEESNTTQNVMVDMMLTMLTGMAANEKQARSASQEAGRKALTKEQWKEKFKGKPKNLEQYELINVELANGTSIRRTAEIIGCGISTVQRAKKHFS
jgi:DNA invertase Pin-like site-specific DNA recombinase